MFEKFKANILFHQLLKRPDIEKAYKMVGPEDSWYDTITKVHNSLAEIQALPHQKLEITSHDGLKLQALYYPGNSDRTMIWVHGYTSHAERESAFPGLFYHSLGFNVLIPYLRAHGPSQGKYITLGALEHRDMLQWVDKINELHPNGGIVIHGLSMGGGIVLDLATRSMKNVKCLVSDAPSTDIHSIFYNVANGVFKADGDRVAKCVIARFCKEFQVDTECFDRLKTVKNCQYPLLLSAGELEQQEDKLAAIQQRNPQNTEIVILPGCNHGNGIYKQTELYQNTIKSFLEKYI